MFHHNNVLSSEHIIVVNTVQICFHITIPYSKNSEMDTGWC